MDQKIFCDCGGGSFTGCSDINKNNPINEELKILDSNDIEKVNEYIDKKKTEDTSDKFQEKMDKLRESKT